MTPADTPPVYLDFLNRFDIEATALTDAEILAAIETSLAAQGRGETAIEPRTHIHPRAGVEGHFNVLRGWIPRHRGGWRRRPPATARPRR